MGPAETNASRRRARAIPRRDTLRRITRLQRPLHAAAFLLALLLTPASAQTVISVDIAALWDYRQPAESEARFRAALPALAGDARLEVLTQIARTFSLRRRFDEAHAVLDEVEPQLKTAGPAPQLRYLLERGRTFRSAKLAEKARPLFVQAWELGRETGEEDLAIDAAHMVAIVDGGAAGIEWNQKALALARSARDARARRWAASLLNNLGHESRQLGRHDDALRYFQEAVPAYEARGNPADLRVAWWQIARTRRDLKQHEAALDILFRLERESAQADAPDGYVFEEIAENLDALGRTAEAKLYFRRAFDTLSRDAWLPRDEPQRLERLNARSK